MTEKSIREQFNEGEIEAGTLVDIIEELHATIENLKDELYTIVYDQQMSETSV